MKAPIIFMFAVSPRFCRNDISADGLQLYGYGQVIFVFGVKATVGLSLLPELCCSSLNEVGSLVMM